MLIASKIAEYIIPDSETNTDAEEYEYFLVWVAPDGGVYCWLFEDFIHRLQISGNVVNTKSDNITKLYENANQSKQLVAEDLSENEFDVISNITRALIVRRYYKDNSFDELAINTSEIVKRKSDHRYDLIIEVEEKEKPLMR